jgi:hypothetical protein
VSRAGLCLKVAKVLAEPSGYEWADIEANGWVPGYLSLADNTIVAAAELGIDTLTLARYEARVRASERENAAVSVEEENAHLRRMWHEPEDTDDYTARVYASCARSVRSANWLERHVAL